jgi:hypothetical protein
MKQIITILLNAALTCFVFVSCGNDFGFETPTIPRIQSFKAAPYVIFKGGYSKITWKVYKGNSENESLFLEIIGDTTRIYAPKIEYTDTLIVRPDTTTQYWLVARNFAGQHNKRITINVQQ